MSSDRPLSAGKKVLSALLAAFVILFVICIIVIKSGSLTQVAVRIASAMTGAHIEAGSIRLSGKDLLVIESLSAEKNDDDPFRLVLPYAEIRFTLRGLLQRHIEGMVLKEPELSFRLKKSTAGRRPLPVTFSTLSVSDADLMIRFGDGNPVHFKPVTLSLSNERGEKYGKLSGSVFIAGLDASLTLNADMEMKGFEIIKAHIETSMIDLARAKTVYPLSGAGVEELKGICSMSMDMETASEERSGELKILTEFSANGLSVRRGAIDVDLRNMPLKITAAGFFSPSRDSLTLGSLDTYLSDLKMLTLSGTINEIRSSAPDVSIMARLADIPVQKIRDIFPGAARMWPAGTDTDARISGDVTASGRLSSLQAAGQMMASGKSLSFRTIAVKDFTADIPFTYRSNSFLLSNASAQAGAISHTDIGKGLTVTSKRLDVAVPSLSYEASVLRTDHVQFSADDTAIKMEKGAIQTLRIENMKARIPLLSLAAAEIRAEGIQFSAESAVIKSGGKEYPVRDIRLSGLIEGDPGQQRFSGRNIVAGSSLFREAKADIDVTAREPLTIEAAADYKDIDLDEISREHLHGFFTEKGYTVNGNGGIHMTVRAVMPENDPASVSGSIGLRITDAGLSSADGTVACEGLQIEASGRFDTMIPASAVNFSAEARASGFELLIGKFYGSFRDSPVPLSASGMYTLKDDTLHLKDSKTRLPGIGEIAMSGKISGVTGKPSFDVSVSAGRIANTETFDFFVRETFQQQMPLLAGIEISGGSSAALSVRGTTSDLSVRGNLRVEDMDLSAGTDDRSLRDVRISLPVDLAYPAHPGASDTDHFGKVRIGELSWDSLKLNDIEFSPAVWQNALIFKDDITIPLLGGHITLKNILYSDILKPERQLRFSLDISGIELEQASRALDLPTFSGKLSGVIPKIRFSGSRLDTEGEIRLAVFGGAVRVSALSADDLFTPIVSMKTDVAFDDIDLGMLTNTFDFGRITGIIRGKFDDLVIVRGQAQGFQGYLESYKKKDIKQKVSVEALKKISILGTGTSSSILDRGIYQLFREYNYDKLGFRAFLKNDNLLLRGIAEEDDRSYLVKGGFLPPKVNVITYTHNISFQEMVSRLKRIEQAGK